VCYVTVTRIVGPVGPGRGSDGLRRAVMEKKRERKHKQYRQVQ
jgi:hypothetical protein